MIARIARLPARADHPALIPVSVQEGVDWLISGLLQGLLGHLALGGTGAERRACQTEPGARLVQGGLRPGALAEQRLRTPNVDLRLVSAAVPTGV